MDIILSTDAMKPGDETRPWDRVPMVLETDLTGDNEFPEGRRVVILVDFPHDTIKSSKEPLPSAQLFLTPAQACRLASRLYDLARHAGFDIPTPPG